MASRRVHVVAPSRLHFGLLSFGHADGRQFGGVGMMIERPAVHLDIVRADRFEVAVGDADASIAFETGPSVSESLASRVVEYARRWAKFHDLPNAPACRITIESAPPQHSGLGVGTQLGLSVAAGLNALYDLIQPTAVELAMSVGRGLRSAVGTYGFVEGGLIVERGKLPGEAIAPLDCRLDLPPDWRVVLIQPTTAMGLSGNDEQQAFDGLPPIPKEVTGRLMEEIRLHMLPAAARGDFDTFSESVYRYGRLAGMCFAAIQGGPYNGPRLQQLVDRIRELGIRGVGQSSWGPTLFALLPDQAAAETFRYRLAAELSSEEATLTETALNQDGAQIRKHGG